MNDLSGKLGGIVGISLVIAVVGWFGLSHFLDTRDDRLPLKVKQHLAHLKDELPLEIEPGLSLTDFDLSRSSIQFELRFDRNYIPQDNNQDIQERLQFVTLVWLCQWRKKFVSDKPFEVNIEFLNKNDESILKVLNTDRDCQRPLSVPKTKT